MAAGSKSDERRIVVGRISGLYGVKGWVKVISFTSPPKNILDYRPWYFRPADRSDDCAGEHAVLETRIHGKGLVALLDGVEDRDRAAEWVGADILVDRERFAVAREDEFYWADLVGLEVKTADDKVVGTVKSLIATGANDVLVVEGHDNKRHLMPFLMGSVVQQVDLDARIIVVDWVVNWDAGK